MSATDYLVESIAEPSAYVVENYKNEMPRVYQPPISLSPEEIQATISYLQSLGGEVDVGAIKLPDKIRQAESTAEEPWKPYMTGDPDMGAYYFFDPEGPAACYQCHMIVDSTGTARGGQVGPELSHVGGTRTPQFIVTSILDPSAEIASGYEQVLIVTKEGEYVDGIPVKQDEKSITLKRKTGNEIIVTEYAKENIEEIIVQDVSMMPENFGDLLTVQQFHDILAFLMTLK